MTIELFLTYLGTPFLYCAICYRGELLYTGHLHSVPDHFLRCPVIGFYIVNDGHCIRFVLASKEAMREEVN